MHTTANQFPKKYDPALQYCIPAARRVTGTAPPSRCKFGLHAAARTTNLPRPSPETHTQRLRFEPQPLGSAMPWSTTPYPCRCGPKTRAPAWNRGPLSPQPIKPPRKETKLRPNKTRPPDVRGESPLVLVVCAQTSLYTAQRPKGRTCHQILHGHAVPPFRSTGGPPQRQGGMG